LDDRDTLLPAIATLAKLHDFAAIVPVSAERGTGLDLLKGALAELLPASPPLYPADALTNRDERFLAAEYIREKVFRQLGDEVPYATAVVIESFEQTQSLRRIRATILVDKPGQRAILVGDGGERMKAIASAARADMERAFGGRVYLEVWVRVKAGWARSDASLTRLGY
ncbi:MAG: GTPase Era, partial [Casimicrobiaceae bacterium]